MFRLPPDPIRLTFRAASFAAALLLALAPAARAVTAERSFPPDAFVALSAAVPDAPFAPGDPLTVANAGSSRAATLLGRLPPDILSVDSNRLESLTLSLAFEASDAPAAPLVLYALTNAYDPDAATWLSRTATNAWRNPGGDSIARQAVTAAVARASIDVPSATTAVWVATFNLFPLFHRNLQGPPFRANGFLVAFAPGSSSAAANPRIAVFPPDPSLPPDAHPAVRAVWCDPFLSFRDYAISGISNGPFHKEYATNATDETVFWEQDLTTVGRVMINTNGFESRAILSMPKSLLPIDPDRIQSVEAHFQCYNNTWHGEDIVLRPVTSPTRLEMAGNRPDNGANPSHGPSWRWADGPVDPADPDYPRLPWTTPGGDVSPRYAAHALLANPNGTFVQNISFDLTPLWRDPAARALLAQNGAIIAADRSTWPGGEWMAVQIYCSDDYTVAYKSANSAFRVTLYPPFDPGDGTPAAAFALLSEAAPDTPSPIPAGAPIPALSAAPGAQTRIAVRLHPGLFAQNPRQVEGIRLFLPLDAGSPPSPGLLARLALYPLSAPFDPATATWSTAPEPLDRPLSPVLSEGRTGLCFDLAPLLASPAASNALATCGAILCLAPDPDDAPPATLSFSAAEAPLPLVLPAPLTLRNPVFTPSAIAFDAYGLSPSASYALDASPSLLDPAWTPILSPIPSDSPTAPFAPTNALFFRLRRLP